MLRLLRAADWWQYKLAPAVALFIATALIEGKALLSLWRDAALVLIALAVCASYVSLINDLSDRKDDGVAGKRNRQLAYSRRVVFALIAVAIAAGAAMVWIWRTEPLLIASYAGSWIAFSLYSLPPLRLKRRGLAGAVCDAAGAHLFPALTAILAASGAGTRDRAWTIAAAVWAFAYGLRGIIWHQLADYDCDTRSGVRTFAVADPTAATRFGAFVAFPVEVAALVILLARLRDTLPIVALGCYVVLLAFRARRFLLVIVRPSPVGVSVLQEYYDIFLPIALLLSAVERDWRAIILLAAFVGLFPRGVRRVADDVKRGLTRAVSMTLRYFDRQRRREVFGE